LSPALPALAARKEGKLTLAPGFVVVSVAANVSGGGFD